MEQTQQSSTDSQRKGWYDKYYKLLMLIPLLLVISSIIYLGMFYSNHNDIIFRDVSLSGGTTITLNGEVNTQLLEQNLKLKYPDSSFKELTDLRTGKTLAFIIESSATPENLQPAVESILGYNLTEENSSIEFTGSTLSRGFYKQLLFALLLSFILMSLVIIIMFRAFIPSITVILATFSNILIPLAIINLNGMRLSAAGIAAFLMLIGYSVDTNILLTTRALDPKKTRSGNLNQRIYGAFKTGSLMTLTALLAIVPAFFIVTGLPDSFKQIFLILALGLTSDLINTWLANAGVIKWYCQRKGIK